MADQSFAISSGFYDSVNGDRLYSADQMNNPYKHIVADGVFATPSGTASTFFQVFATSGMVLSVYPGSAIVGGKWFESATAQAVTVPANSAANPRIDSVILRVDKNLSVRAGAIIYRQGTAAASPSAPALDTADGVTEYRVANIAVAASASSISQADITDLRGTSACPWVAGVVQQVDTSTLLAQYQAAYAAFQEHMKTEWDAFMETLQSDYDVNMNLVRLQNAYTSTGSVTDVPIGITSYDPDTDDLQVYINGIHATEGTHYTIAADGSKITLASAISSGQTVLFQVFKAVMGGATAAKYIVETYAGTSLGGSLQSIKDAIDYLYAHATLT